MTGSLTTKGQHKAKLIDCSSSSSGFLLSVCPAMARDNSNAAVAVSAPGKVLLAGGYLVLDREYNGLVFGLDARIHCVVQDVPTRNGVTLSQITVRSPQFEDAVWEYGYTMVGRDGGMQMRPLRM